MILKVCEKAKPGAMPNPKAMAAMMKCEGDMAMPPTIKPKSSEVGAARDGRPLSATNLRKLGVLLWILQGLLALIFLFAGGVKLVLPLDALTKQVLLPGLFLRFIGVAEVFGAIGLLLPGLLRVRSYLTPLASTGLVIIMIGATAITLRGGDVGKALIPFVAGLLSAFVAYGRWRLAPHRGPSHVLVD